jgi:hypothetical protein
MRSFEQTFLITPIKDKGSQECKISLSHDYWLYPQKIVN